MQQMLRDKYDYIDGYLVKKGYVMPIGSIDKDGYRVAMIDREEYRHARLVWTYHHGNIPDGMQIDHINRIRCNDDIHNLRVVTPRKNRMNQGMSSANTSGCTGVHYSTSKHRWIARIIHTGGNRMQREFKCKDDAVTQRKLWERLYYS